MEIKNIVVGKLETNCYILSKDKKCLIIDPGDEGNKIIANIKDEVIGIIITHHHFDHIGSLKEVSQYYNCPIYDYSNLKDNNIIGPFSFKRIKTPGHTDDSITIYFDQENIMFVGDFIFYNSIGRMDLGGNINDMKKSIESILLYQDDIKLYPGHFISTSIGEERKNLERIIKML